MSWGLWGFFGLHYLPVSSSSASHQALDTDRYRPTAQALVEETGDKELKEILLSAVTKVTTEAKLG